MSPSSKAHNSLPHEDWRPVVDGRLRAEVLSVIDDITQDLAQPLASWPLHRQDDPAGIRAASLASGRAGIALFFHVLAQTTGQEAHRGRAAQLLDEAADAMAERPMSSSLYCGFPGVAWLAEYMQASTDEEDDALLEIDAALDGLLSRGPWPGVYDLVNGLAGIGVYLVSRLPGSSAWSSLHHLLERLDELSETQVVGTSWPSRTTGQDARTEIFFNLGVSHGVPGILGFLAQAVTATKNAAAHQMLQDGMDWLRAQRQPAREDSEFPHFCSSAPALDAYRSTWCYGDVGVAGVLLNIGMCMQDHAALDLALGIGRRAATRRTVHADVPLDGGICHGYAGLAHVYNRFYQASGEEVFREAVTYWLQELLEIRRPRSGVGGFNAWCIELDRRGAWEADPCLLTGSAGIGLVLLAAVSESAPDWDTLFLLGHDTEDHTFANEA